MSRTLSRKRRADEAELVRQFVESRTGRFARAIGGSPVLILDDHHIPLREGRNTELDWLLSQAGAVTAAHTTANLARAEALVELRLMAGASGVVAK